jgi:hypothetical protein
MTIVLLGMAGVGAGLAVPAGLTEVFWFIG